MAKYIGMVVQARVDFIVYFEAVQLQVFTDLQHNACGWLCRQQLLLFTLLQYSSSVPVIVGLPVQQITLSIFGKSP